MSFSGAVREHLRHELKFLRWEFPYAAIAGILAKWMSPAGLSVRDGWIIWFAAWFLGAAVGRTVGVARRFDRWLDAFEKAAVRRDRS